MMRFKDIETYLDKNNIDFYRTDNGQHIIIPACAFDSEKQSNFFDYEEPYKKPRCYTKDKMLKELFNDPRIIVIDCSDCCRCAGW